MSRKAPPTLAIEWSGKTWRVFDAQTGATSEYAMGDSLPFGGRDAVLALGRRNAFVRFVRVPNAGAEEVRTILAMRMTELFPSTTGELAYDFQLTSDVNPEGRLAMLAAVPASELRTILDALKQQSIRVTRTVPVALGAGVTATEAGIQDAIVTESRPDGVTLDVVVNGELRASRVATPGTPIEVELKRTVSLVGTEVTAVITVGGISLPSARTSSTGALQALLNPASEKNKLSLELPEAKQASAKLTTDRHLRLGAVLILAAILAGYLLYEDRGSAAQVVSREKGKYANALKKMKAGLSSAEGERAKFQELDKTLSQAFEPAQKISDMATLIANTLPKGSWLTGLSVERGKPMLIRGTALDSNLPKIFLDRLQQESRFRNVTLLFSNGQKIDEVDVVQFSIQAFPVGNLPILETKKRGARPASPAVKK